MQKSTLKKETIIIRLEPRVFAQHCFSTLFTWSVNKPLTVLLTDISDSNF